MSDRLGGALARKPLHFIFVLDVSGSMMRGGRIQALNNAISEVLPHLKDEARANPHAEMLIRVLAFANEPRWVIEAPTPVDQIHWERLEAVPRGFTELGSALLTLTDALAQLDESSSAYPPAIILVSDGRPTQSSGTTFAEGLQALLNNRWGATAVRLALGRGSRRRHALAAPVHRRRGHPAAARRQPRAAGRVHRLGVQGRQQGRFAAGRRRRRSLRCAAEPDRRPDLEHARVSPEQHQPGWTVLSASRIGSVHLRDELPLQDAVLTWTDGRQAVAAVADGHGHKAHFRSDIGSALAAVSAVEEMRRVVGDLSDPEVGGRPRDVRRRGDRRQLGHEGPPPHRGQPVRPGRRA